MSSLRCFYAADIHGSEVCWRKFLNAGRFYRADLLILGGDIVGKAVVPIEVASKGVGKAVLQGQTHELETADSFAVFEKKVRDSGFYPCRVGREELEHLRGDDQARRALFERLVRESLERWLRIAEEKHDPAVRVLVMGGNDDPWFVDEELAKSPHLQNGDGEVIEIDGLELLSLGVSNPTPWHTHRELEEDVLLQRIQKLTAQLTDPSRAIFNIHVPPFGSGLDEAPLLDDTLRPVTRMGQLEIVPVGSQAVRQAMEEIQPLLGLHGHIHESRGIRQVGTTIAINPGSEYTTGRIHGALVEFKRGGVKGSQLVMG